MQNVIAMFRLAFGIALLPFVAIVVIWWVVLLPFRALGAFVGDGRYYSVLSNGRSRSYFVTRW